jgi:hypothetical protein
MANCCICGRKVKVWGGQKVMLKGKNYACFDCVKKAGHNPLTWTKNLSTTPEMLKAEIVQIEAGIVSKNNKEIMQEKINRTRHVARASVSDTFVPDKSFSKRFFVDTIHKKWQALRPVHNYEDLVSYEYQEDGGTVVSGGVGNAIAGSVLFGGVGAIVGAATGKKKQSDFVNSMKIRLTVNSMSNPTEYIDMNPIRMSMKRSSGQYRKILEETQEILSCLELIIRDSPNNTAEPENKPTIDSVDEILRYKKLLDAGAITQEEYDAKKNQLLNM